MLTLPPMKHPTRERLDSLSVIAVQGIDVTAQLAAGIWTARILGPEGNGDFVFAMSTVGMVAVIPLFGTGEVAIRMHADRALDGRAVLGAQISIWAMGTCVAGVAAALIGLLAQVGATPLLALAAAFGVLAANGLTSTFNALVLAHRLSRLDVLGMLLSRATLLGCIAFGVRFGVLGVIASHAMAAAVLLIARALLIRRALGITAPRLDRAMTRMLFQDGRHVGVGSLFGSIAARLDVVALRSWSGAYEAGLYGACYRILNGVSAVTTAISLALYARLARARGGQPDHEAERLFVAVPIVMALCLALAATLASPLVTTLYGAAFARAASTLQVLLVAGIAQTGNAFLHKGLVARGRERSLPFAQGAQALVNVVLNVVLVPRYGAFGAALATLVCECVAPIGHAVYFTFESRTTKAKGAAFSS